jgi:REP element-mobilizing transposase RayT
MKQREFHPPHIYEDNACYFISASIVHRQRLLDTDAKRVLVRDVLKEAIKEYGIRLYAWVILADHYHCYSRPVMSLPFTDSSSDCMATVLYN